MIGFVALAAMLSVAAAPAALLDENPISLEEVDKATAGRAEALEAKLAEVVAAAVWREVDRQLGVTEPPARRASREEIERRRSRVTSPLEGEELDAALRWQIEREYRRADRAAARETARAAAEVELLLPESTSLPREIPADRVVARGRGVLVRGGQIESNAALHLYRLRGELFRERQRRLEERIEARLLEREARRRGRSVAELLPAVSVTSEEVEAYVAEQRARGRNGLEAAQVEPLLRARAAHAERAALVAALRTDTTIEILLSGPTPPQLDGRDSIAPTLGADDPEAPTLVVFADYRSAPSRHVHAAVDAVMASRPDLRIEVRDFIVGYDPGARQAAALVRCAAAEGAAARARRAVLDRAPSPLGREWCQAHSCRDVAREAQLGVEALEGCMAADETRAAIERDTADALDLGFTRPPAMLVDGLPLTGVQSAETIRSALREAGHAREHER